MLGSNIIAGGKLKILNSNNNLPFAHLVVLTDSLSLDSHSLKHQTMDMVACRFFYNQCRRKGIPKMSCYYTSPIKEIFFSALHIQGIQSDWTPSVHVFTKAWYYKATANFVSVTEERYVLNLCQIKILLIKYCGPGSIQSQMVKSWVYGRDLTQKQRLQSPGLSGCLQKYETALHELDR